MHRRQLMFIQFGPEQCGNRIIFAMNRQQTMMIFHDTQYRQKLLLRKRISIGRICFKTRKSCVYNIAQFIQDTGINILQNTVKAVVNRTTSRQLFINMKLMPQGTSFGTVCHVIDNRSRPPAGCCYAPLSKVSIARYFSDC